MPKVWHWGVHRLIIMMTTVKNLKKTHQESDESTADETFEDNQEEILESKAEESKEKTP
jgi:hypothetical protein